MDDIAPRNGNSDTQSVGVVIPARNAAETIRDTLDSLQAQSFSGWRAVIVDDGSTDTTRQIAGDYACADARIQIVQGPARGVSAARNVGIAEIASPWLLFLDADDTVAPDMLERMLAALAADPSADAVHCGWTFIDPEGVAIGAGRCEEVGPDLFPAFAGHCAFAIHACVVRRAKLLEVGGFDESLRTSEDFDLWQRVARSGARFTSVAQPLASYRLRERASWFDGAMFARDALSVVRRGHARDARLAEGVARPAHELGEPRSELPNAEFQIVAWAGAFSIARGEDPAALLEMVDAAPVAAIDANGIAIAIFRALPLALCQPVSAWASLWPRYENMILTFLSTLEQRAGMPLLARRARHILEQHVLGEMISKALREDGTRSTLISIGSTAALLVDVADPLVDTVLPEIDRLICAVRCDEEALGTFMLPVSDGVMPAAVLADAIATRHAWSLLRHLFEKTVYPNLEIRRDDTGWSILRAGTLLASGLDGCDAPSGTRLHDCVGWTVFIQELLGLPDWSVNQLYDPSIDRSGSDSVAWQGGQPIQVELSACPVELSGISDAAVLLEAIVGGSPVILTRLDAGGTTLSDGAIRSALLDRGKMELARVAVREGILGFASHDPDTLNQRLRAKAAAWRDCPTPKYEVLAGSPCAGRAAQWAAFAATSIEGADQGAVVVIGSTQAQASGSIALRRASLPADALDLLLATIAPGQAALRIGDGAVGRILYLPELRRTEAADALASSSENVSEQVDSKSAIIEPGGAYGRHHFESLFASGADPWQYTSSYEQTKYEQTLAMLPTSRRVRALEIGCAEGHFTAQLAPRVAELVAADISEVALQRAADRCSAFRNISYIQLDLATQPVPKGFDLIVCSEILYYMGDRSALANVGEKLASALKPGGWLITAHANLVVDAPDECGFDWRMSYGAKVIGETFADVDELSFERELRTPLYRIQAFKRRGGSRLFASFRSRGTLPKVTIAEHSLPEADVAQHILWSGGSVQPENATPITTSRLPILMYHRVAPAGAAQLSRWRVTPEQFDQQMRYLRGAGFSPTTFEEWRAAREAYQPLPGRRMLITFDDGYSDFSEYALPSLQRHGFSATIFLPSNLVGHHAHWDAWSGEAAALLNWDTARALRDSGILFGSHAASHCRLTDLNSLQIVEEAVRSRLTLEHQLEMPIQTIAYPFGAVDEAVTQIVGACGYRHGVTTRSAYSDFSEADLALSRVEISGNDTLEQFIAKLGG